MEVRVLTEEEFLAHKASLANRAIQEYLYRCLEGLKSQWAMGLLSDSNAYKQKAAVDSALAEYRATERLLSLDYEQYSGVMNDDDYSERIRNRTNWPSDTLRTVHARGGELLARAAGAGDGTGADAGDEGD